MTSAKLSALLLGVFGMAGGAAHASIIYEFSGTLAMFPGSVAFHYTAPNFITSDTLIPASALDSCQAVGFVSSASCTRVSFLPAGPDSGDHIPELTVDILQQGGSFATLFYYFPSITTFATLGTIPAGIANPGTLVISSAVPEPSTGLSLLIGCRLLAAQRRTSSPSRPCDSICRTTIS